MNTFATTHLVPSEITFLNRMLVRYSLNVAAELCIASRFFDLASDARVCSKTKCEIKFFAIYRTDLKFEYWSMWQRSVRRRLFSDSRMVAGLWCCGDCDRLLLLVCLAYSLSSWSSTDYHHIYYIHMVTKTEKCSQIQIYTWNKLLHKHVRVAHENIMMIYVYPTDEIHTKATSRRQTRVTSSSRELSLHTIIIRHTLNNREAVVRP